MSLHPVARQLLDDAAASDQPNSHLLPVEVARDNFERMFAGMDVQEVASVEELVVATGEEHIPVRLYRPRAGGVLPLVVYLHGGGWQMGSLASHDGVCRAIANESGCAVLSVEYRRPPEAKFPTAPHDCYAALVWAVDHADQLATDRTRIAVVGDSAGGNLAAAVSLLARDDDGPELACQVLIYPATTFDLDRGFDVELEGYVLFRDEVQWHKDAYFSTPEDAKSDYASPLDADLSGLPATFVLTAEYDPLGKAGLALVERLRSQGVPTEHRQYDGMIHGFVQFPDLFDDATVAIGDIGAFLQRHVGTA
ncbi:acetyl esterase [Nocardioides aromaticivorans]|uniref:Acetyl esterase n=1 Tax=Nocardioides aromaticivorans TaxID=200618 RepID=A0A7Y9ZJF7_9ACTN|nr:alpha/beta hydrolase [Nocardioides aromaticivorans]NYI44546.1 acetyl esterase [Nocardioides aromaticivorans]